MGLPQQFQSIVQQQLNVYAAWLPITNPYKLGDYGLISDGVFQKLGNIKDEFNVAFTEEAGQEASLSFVSDKATVIDIGTGAQINLTAQSDIKADVKYKFNQDKSFLIKAPVINVSQIANVNEVGNHLKTIGQWRQTYKVIFQVYTAQNPLILSTIDSDTEVTFKADATALPTLNIGNASANFSIQSTKALGLELSGKTGVIAIGLFKLNWLTRNAVFLGDPTDERTDLKVENISNKPLTDDL